MTVEIIKHEVIPDCGSFEVRFSDGTPSQYFYWDDNPGRRASMKNKTTSKQAFEAAKAFAGNTP